jgi:two-component system, NtrC family, response regulator AtoC
MDSSERTTLMTAGSALGLADLLLVAGNGQLSTHELAGREMVIGRDTTCDIVIDHRSLSRRHAVLHHGPPVTVQDLGSTNGTMVGGTLRRGGEPVALASGEGFRIGPFWFALVGRAPGERSMSSGAGELLRVTDPTAGGVPRVVRDFAASGANVLILGETGVGKEVLAATIHELSGRRGAMTRINCAALSESLLESELFGHEKGAFTGATGQRIGLIEAADGGTLFLDEIGDAPLSIQAKLLRTVEHREVTRLGSTRPVSVDVRFVAATNRDLPAEVAAGTFRRDLYFRLDGVTIVIPSLRERRGQIGRLALEFAAAGAARGAHRAAPLSPQVLAALEAHEWTGNVRELKAVIERAVVLAGSGTIGVEHVARALGRARDAAPRTALRAPPPPAGPAPSAPARTAPSAPSAPAAPAALAPPVPSASGGDHLDDEQRADRERILRALEECAGNQTRAARQLGMSRTAFVTRLRIYRIPRPRS